MLVLELQKINIENNDERNNSGEADREVGTIRGKDNKTRNAPACKNDEKIKHWNTGYMVEIMSSQVMD